MRELPNYPPTRWAKTENHAWKDTVPGKSLRLVYVGSLSTDTTFIEELVSWVACTPDVELDVYSYNYSSEIPKLFDEMTCETIRFHSTGIAYDEMPDLLSRYHVGLILYKGTTRNYVYNASNKLFEYMALDLDIWYPQQMLGVKPFSRDNASPRVIEVNFEELDALPLDRLRQRDNLASVPSTMFCENALGDLSDQIWDRNTTR